MEGLHGYVGVFFCFGDQVQWAITKNGPRKVLVLASVFRVVFSTTSVINCFGRREHFSGCRSVVHTSLFTKRSVRYSIFSGTWVFWHLRYFVTRVDNMFEAIKSLQMG